MNIVTAKDKRVKCLSVQLTFEDGERVITGNLSEQEKLKLLATLNKVWIKTVTHNQIMKLPVNKALSDEQSIAFFNKATHYEIYEGPLFQQVIGKQLEWFRQYL